MNLSADKALGLAWPVLWLSSLALLSLSASAAGLAWALSVLAGGALGWRAGLMPWREAPGWLRTWVHVALLAAVCQGVMVLYWHDPWGERHGEIRLLLGALAVWAGCRAALDWRTWLARAATALGLAAWAGLGLVLVAGREAVPTHPIPWAGGLGMASVWLLAMGLWREQPAALRRFWLASGLAAVMAVLASRSRGAFGVLLWWALVGLMVWWRQGRPWPGSASRWRWPLAAMLAALMLLLSMSPVVQRPLQAWHEAVDEVRLSRTDMAQASETSVGARLYLWRRSLEQIAQSPWLGHGRAARKHYIQQWAQEAQSDVVQQLGHVHNEYLHQLLDHGLPGLLSQLLYIFGLLLVARQLQRSGHGLTALSVAGVVFMHASASLSNVNFAHNYYTSMLSLVLMLSLCMALPRARAQAAFS
jgi:O-antigen ligase